MQTKPEVLNKAAKQIKRSSKITKTGTCLQHNRTFMPNPPKHF